MKRRFTIALVAILTLTLALTGCAATPVESTHTEEAPQLIGFGEEPAETTAHSTGYRGGSGDANSNSTTEGDNCGPSYSPNTTADSDFSLSESDKTLSLTGYGAEGALDDDTLTLADMLTYAIQDEYLARAEYARIIADFGSVRPFTNIMRAEETHIKTLLPLFDAYGIIVPADEGASHAVAVSSLTTAYQAGVSAEVSNIAMYDTFLEQELPDNVRTIFESLMRASENHLRAFQNRL